MWISLGYAFSIIREYGERSWLPEWSRAEGFAGCIYSCAWLRKRWRDRGWIGRVAIVVDVVVAAVVVVVVVVVVVIVEEFCLQKAPSTATTKTTRTTTRRTKKRERMTRTCTVHQQYDGQATTRKMKQNSTTKGCIAGIAIPKDEIS